MDMRSSVDSFVIRRLFRRIVNKMDGSNYFESNLGSVMYELGEDECEYISVWDLDYGSYRISINPYGEFFGYRNMACDVVITKNINKVFDSVDYRYQNVSVSSSTCKEVFYEGKFIGSYFKAKVLENSSLSCNKKFSDEAIVSIGDACIHDVDVNISAFNDKIMDIFKANGKTKVRK